MSSNDEVEDKIFAKSIILPPSIAIILSIFNEFIKSKQSESKSIDFHFDNL